VRTGVWTYDACMYSLTAVLSVRVIPTARVTTPPCGLAARDRDSPHPTISPFSVFGDAGLEDGDNNICWELEAGFFSKLLDASTLEGRLEPAGW